MLDCWSAWTRTKQPHVHGARCHGVVGSAVWSYRVLHRGDHLVYLASVVVELSGSVHGPEQAFLGIEIFQDNVERGLLASNFRTVESAI